MDVPAQGGRHEPHRCDVSVLSLEPRMRRLVQLAAASALIALSGSASAAPCAGFEDLDGSNSFCANVEWLRNRAITLGCTTVPVPTYCPDDKVLRSSMAAFLNRLANALTPATEGGILAGQGVDYDATPIVCAQPQFPVTGFPRLAHGHAVATVSSVVGSAELGVTFVESTNNGASYNAVSPTHATDVTTNSPATVAIILPPRTLEVGTSYRYGLRVSRLGGVVTAGTDGQVSCEIKIFFENRNGVTPPLDEAL